MEYVSLDPYGASAVRGTRRCAATDNPSPGRPFRIGGAQTRHGPLGGDSMDKIPAGLA